MISGKYLFYWDKFMVVNKIYQSTSTNYQWIDSEYSNFIYVHRQNDIHLSFVRDKGRQCTISLVADSGEIIQLDCPVMIVRSFIMHIHVTWKSWIISLFLLAHFIHIFQLHELRRNFQLHELRRNVLI